MKPHEIQSLLRYAKSAREQSPSGIHVFALYWITWEAYRTRMLAVAARLNGWRIDDAYYAIGVIGISSQKTYKRCFKKVTGVQLAEQTGLLGRVWKSLDEIEILRHRLVHDYRGANPQLIGAAVDFLDSILSNHIQVFSKLQIPSKVTNCTYPLGNVLAQHPAAGRGIPIQLNRDALVIELTEKPGNKRKKSLGDQITLKALRNISSELSQTPNSLHMKSDMDHAQGFQNSPKLW